LIVHTDDGRAARLHIRRQPLLDGCVIGHAAVTIEMVFRDVQKDADRRPQGRREIDLVG
jgi:hypothetical protein